MKKLMILTAILASGVMAFGADLSGKFTASEAAADTWKTGWTVPTNTDGVDKATLDTDKGVIKIETGSDALSRHVTTDASQYLLGDSTSTELYFDVSLDFLNQALDEVPTVADDGQATAKLALFLLDTTEIEGVKTEEKGTNLFAIAGNPAGGKLLLKLNTEASSLMKEGTTSRLTVQTYKTVLANKEWGGFAVYRDGGTLTGTVEPIKIARTYSYKADGTVDWSSTDILGNGYLKSGDTKARTDLWSKRESLLLCLAGDGVGGQSFNRLDFVGNANLSSVEVTAERYDFIAEDKQPTTASVTLEGVSITVDPADVYDAVAKTLTGDCTITVTKNEGLDVLKYTMVDTGSLKDNGDGTFAYTFASGNDISFRAAAASVTLNGTAYETLAEAMNAEVLEDGNLLTLNRDLNDADIGEDGYLPLTGNWTLDLAGKNIVAAGDFANSEDGLGVIYLAEGSLVITNSTEILGSVEATAANGVAVSCELENATLSIFNGIFKGAIHDKALDSSEEEAADEEAAEGETAEVTPNVTIYGGRFTVEPNAVWIPEGYAATQQTIDGVAYWVVAEAASETFTVTFVNEKGATEAEQKIEKSVESGKTVAVPDAPTADGFVFLGWFADGADTAFDFATEITANITLTAKWGEVVAKVGETGYATLQAAVDAALKVASTAVATVEIVGDITLTDTLTIAATDAESIALTIKNESHTVSVDAAIGSNPGIRVDGVSLTFTGDGTWKKMVGAKTFICVGEKTAPANVTVEGGTFTVAQCHVMTAQNGTITVNGGTLTVETATNKYCVRVEKSDSGDNTMTGFGVLVVNGGMFSTPTGSTVPPVGVKDADSATAGSAAYVNVAGAAKFAGSETQICDTMKAYLATAETTESGTTYTHVATGWEFAKGEDGWYVATETTPAYTPVDPETPTACDSEDAANAMAAAINADKATLINAPADLTDTQKTAYRDLFTATVVSTTTEGATTYSVTVALTDAATTDIQAQIDGDVKTLEVATVAAADGDTKQAVTTTPGIYYSVVAGSTLDGMEVRSSTMATGETLEVTLPKYEGAGFYRIKATVKPETVVNE